MIERTYRRRRKQEIIVGMTDTQYPKGGPTRVRLLLMAIGGMAIAIMGLAGYVANLHAKSTKENSFSWDNSWERDKETVYHKIENNRESTKENDGRIREIERQFVKIENNQEHMQVDMDRLHEKMDYLLEANDD